MGQFSPAFVTHISREVISTLEMELNEGLTQCPKSKLTIIFTRIMRFLLRMRFQESVKFKK
jgi:hypothetical protein